MGGKDWQDNLLNNTLKKDKDQSRQGLYNNPDWKGPTTYNTSPQAKDQ